MATSGQDESIATAVGSRFFDHWGQTVTRFRWLACLLAVVTTAGFLAAIANHLKVENHHGALLPEDSPESIAFDQLEKTFGSDEIFYLVAAGDVFTIPYLTRLRALHNDLQALDLKLPSRTSASDKRPSEATEAGSDWGDAAGGSIFEEVTSLINARDTRWVDGGLRVGELLETPPAAAELGALRKRVLADPTLVKRFVGADGTHSVIELRSGDMEEEQVAALERALRNVAEQHATEGFTLHLAGWPAIQAGLNTTMMEDSTNGTVIAIFLMALVLTFVFRSVLCVVGPLLVVICSVFWTLGSMALLGWPSTMVTSVLPAFLICTGIGDSIHIQSTFRDARRDGQSSLQAARYAVSTTAIPTLFSSLTTGVGLLSFRFAGLEPIANLGGAAAIGIMSAWLLSITIIPALLTFTRGIGGSSHTVSSSATWVARVVDRLDALSRPRVRGRMLTYVGARWVSAIGILIMVSSVALASNVKLSHDALTWFPEDMPVRQGFAEMDKHVGGTADIALLLTAATDGALVRHATLEKLEKLEREILSFSGPQDRIHVSTAFGILDLLREGWKSLHENDPRYYQLPPNDRSVRDTLMALETGGSTALQRVLSIDERRAVVHFRVGWMDAQAYAPLASFIEKRAAELFGDDVDVQATGSVFNDNAVMRSLVHELLQSFMLTLVVITLLLIFMLRSIKLGLLAIIPNLIPVSAVASFMLIAGIPLDVTNVLIASIAIGVAVDDTIHLFHHVRVRMAGGMSIDEAVSGALHHVGRPMMLTSVVLVVGFCTDLAMTMVNLQRFGALTASVVVCALLADLIVAPAVLRTFFARARPVGPGDEALDHDSSDPQLARTQATGAEEQPAIIELQ